MKNKNPQIHEIARNMNHKDYLKLLGYISNVIKVNRKELIEEYEKMIDETAKSYGDVVGFRILRQQLQKMKEKK